LALKNKWKSGGDHGVVSKNLEKEMTGSYWDWESFFIESNLKALGSQRISKSNEGSQKTK